MLKDKIVNKKPGILTYGITPPKQSHTPEKISEIAQKQLERLSGIDMDALIIYDVQDEAERQEQERPFPYLPTLEPTLYSNAYLDELKVPKIIYRCVGKYTERELSEWIASDSSQDRYAVFVGASSSKQQVRLRLPDAYAMSHRLNDRLLLGGVLIPERHTARRDEHLRVIDKAQSGCRFFVTQATYNVEASKNFLSDYYYYCERNEIEMVPILFNIAPCGSSKTLGFMKWLGISLPRWLENDLMHSNDILDKSIRVTHKIFEEIFEFGLEKGIPIGCSVESVSTRKVEIEASIQLVKDIQSSIAKKLAPAEPDQPVM